MGSQRLFWFFISLSAVALVSLNFSSCSSSRRETVSNETPPVPVPSEAVKKAEISLPSVEPEKVHTSYIDPPKDSVIEISVNLVGDLMCHMPQANNSKTANGYDFDPCFEFVKDYLSDADVTIGNLELTTAGTRIPYSGYPNFNAPDEYITALKHAGFDFLVTSNNHSMDTGEEGLLRTIEQVKKNGIGYTGTFNSQKDHDSIRVISVKGMNIAVLNYTYGTNGSYPEPDHKFMLNVIDSATIVGEVKKALQLHPDFVLVFYHYGVEYAAEPIEAQRKAVAWARDAGASLIIGAHPHVVGPCKWLLPDYSHPDTAFVAWSLGNFFSNQPKRYTDAGVILTIKLQKNLTKGKARISSAEFLPTWVYRGEKSDKKKHIIFPSASYCKSDLCPSYLDSSLVKKMREAYEDTREIINKYGPAAALKPLRP